MFIEVFIILRRFLYYFVVYFFHLVKALQKFMSQIRSFHKIFIR